MPVDAEPSYAGNVLIENRQGLIRATVLSVAESTALAFPIPEEPRLRTSHFATCPDADAWRKREHH
jgi:hypothetical protein